MRAAVSQTLRTDSRADTEARLAAGGPVARTVCRYLLLCKWEDGLPSMLNIRQVEQDCRHPLTAGLLGTVADLTLLVMRRCGAAVTTIIKVVLMRVVLLSGLILEDLHGLPVRSWQLREHRHALLDGLHNLVLRLAQEHS